MNKGEFMTEYSKFMFRFSVLLRKNQLNAKEIHELIVLSLLFVFHKGKTSEIVDLVYAKLCKKIGHIVSFKKEDFIEMLSMDLF